MLKWVTLFQESGGVSADIDSLQIGALEIEKGIVAKVLVKGDRDVRAACDVLTHDRKFSIEKAQLRLVNPYRKTTVVLSGTGAAVFSSDTSAEELLSPLRIALTDAMKSVSPS